MLIAKQLISPATIKSILENAQHFGENTTNFFKIAVPTFYVICSYIFIPIMLEKQIYTNTHNHSL